jgi:hypothetical protein
MGVWKFNVSLRMRGELRAEMMVFAAREKRSLGNLGIVLLEWAFEQVKAAGSTTKLFGRSAKRLNAVVGRSPENKRDFIAQKARNEAEVSLRRPTRSQEANVKEKASVCSVRNDGGEGDKRLKHG